jgi:hypothetical protein
MPETIHVLGEGGAVIAMDLPLPDAIAHRMTTGQLRRVNEDGSPYPEPAEPDVPSLPSQAPPTSAPKSEWVGWAVANGADPAAAEAMTKADLIEAHGV